MRRGQVVYSSVFLRYHSHKIHAKGFCGGGRNPFAERRRWVWVKRKTFLASFEEALDTGAHVADRRVLGGFFWVGSCRLAGLGSPRMERVRSAQGDG